MYLLSLTYHAYVIKENHQLAQGISCALNILYYFFLQHQSVFMATVALSNQTVDLPSTESSIVGRPSYSDIFLFLRVWVLLVISFIGLIANIISFLVIIRSNIKETSIGVYLLSLSVFDSVYLVMTPLFHVPSYGFDVNLVEGSKIFCKVYYISIFVSSLSSAWVITAMTCERCLIITNPYSITSNKTLRRRAIAITSLILFTSTVIYIHIAITYDSIRIPRVLDISSGEILEYWNICVYTPEYEHFGSNIFSWIHLTIYSALPTVIILTCNIVIIIFVVKARKNKRIKASKSGKSNASNRMTTMLLINSIFFLITTLPIIIYYYWFIDSAGDFNSLPWTILLNINLLNYSCNFFIYLLSGKKFRDEATKLFSCKHEPSKDASEVQMTTATSVVEPKNFFVVQE